jgi:hypothetical protein
MGLLVNLGEKKSLTFKSTDIRGVDLVSYNVQDNTGEGRGQGDPNVEGIDWSRVYINITLNQGGHSHTIAATSVKPLAQHLNYLSNEFRYCANEQMVSDYDGDTKIGGATLDFGGVINLRGEDSLVVEIRVQSDCVNTNWSTTASYIEMDGLEGVGLQYTTPIFKTFAINGGESKFSHSIGENTTAVSIQNISSSPSTDKAYSPWQNARLFSDRFNTNDDWGQLWSKRVSLFESAQDTRYQSFVISLETTDDTQIQLDLFPLNNQTNENYVCYSQFLTNATIVRDASRRAKKHAEKSIQKIAKG